MNLQGSIIAINKIDESIWKDYLNAFNYIELDSKKSFTNFEEFQDYLVSNYHAFEEKDIFIRGRWQDSKATYIFDPEMTDSVSKEEVSKFTNLINQPIYNFLNENVSNSIRISQVNKEDVTEFHRIGNELIDKKGEIEIFSIDENLSSSQQIILSSKKIGFDIVPTENINFEVIQLQWTKEYKDFFDKNIAITDEDIYQMSIPKINHKKKTPWWKFW